MLKVDLHLHTINSGHAFCTVNEYINQAKTNNMQMIGFADHGPALESSLTNEIYFSCLPRIPRKIGDLMVLKGIEANIIDIDGKIDISDKIIDKLDFVIAGLHLGASCDWKNNIKNNTKAVVNTIKSGKINVVSHPYYVDRYQTDIKTISLMACEYEVLLEVNLHYLLEKKMSPSTIPDVITMIDVVKQHQQKVIVNSDAHNIWEMADDTSLKKIQDKIGLTEEMIINNYPEEILKKFKINE
jgi:putative hydrolase